jgi:lipoate---protein ligase
VTLAFRDIAADASFSVTFPEVVEPVVVLGRSQRADVRGLPAARRMSGGGAVLLTPGEVVWADVVLPRSDPRWDDDVGQAAWWLGDAWREVLRRLGFDGTEVHRGGVVRCTPWCKDICFGGLGPGEVHADQRKVVGIAQRRTRHGALFQCALNLRWDPAPLVAALGLDDGALGDLVDAVIAVDRPAAAVQAELLAVLEVG